jgi:hypothetical protein
MVTYWTSSTVSGERWKLNVERISFQFSLFTFQFEIVFRFHFSPFRS